MKNLTQLAIFAQVVESKSFSAAAAQLGQSKSAVSKHIAQLEACLGAQLLHRTTRHLSLTEVGTKLYERFARILAEVQEAEAEVARLHEVPRGLLKINAHASFGALHLAPAMAEFMTCYPDVRADLTLTNRIVDPIEEGLDLVIRLADQLPDSSLIVRRLAPNHVVVCATPAYFTRYGVPRTPDELQQHNCLMYAPLGQQQWRFQGSHGEYTVPVTGNFQANTAEALRAAVVSGLGVGILPTFLVGQDVQARVLQIVFPGQVAFTSAVYALYPPTRHLIPKVRVLVDFLAARFGPRPSWDDAFGHGEEKSAPARPLELSINPQRHPPVRQETGASPFSVEKKRDRQGRHMAPSTIRSAKLTQKKGR